MRKADVFLIPTHRTAVCQVRGSGHISGPVAGGVGGRPGSSATGATGAPCSSCPAKLDERADGRDGRGGTDARLLSGFGARAGLERVGRGTSHLGWVSDIC